MSPSDFDGKENVSEIVPFLKWAGGKRWLMSRTDGKFAPKKFNTYLEPFLGSGASYFKLRPEKAILSDVNEDLINTYQAIKEDWKKVQKNLEEYQRLHCKDFYYQVRDQESRNLFKTATRFIYLNRTCWNGLYRENLKGKFNVPIGTKNSVILETDNFEGVSDSLKNAKLFVSDFEKIVDLAKKNDFLFVDPPYTVKHETNGFIKYNEKLFSWADQERLKDALVRASKRGAYILITNACHSSISRLYWGTGFTKSKVTRSSVIAGAAKDRGHYHEYIIKNY